MDGAESTTTLGDVESVEITPAPGKAKRVSLSELNTYRDCRRKWYLEYHLKLKRRDKSGALALGSNVHEALQVYYEPDGSVQKAMERFESIYAVIRHEASDYEIDDVEKDFELGHIMLEGYFQWAEETGVDQMLEIIEPEAEIEWAMDVYGVTVILMGKRDIIARNLLTDTNVLMDHKTCQTFDDPILDLNEQGRMYLMLQRLVGSTEVQELLWNMLRKVKRSARAKPPFYKREELYVSEEELRRFFVRVRGMVRDLLMTEAQLADGADHFEFCYPRPSRDCNWKCQYRKVCPVMDQDPAAADQMLRDMFELTDPYERYDIKGV